MCLEKRFNRALDEAGKSVADVARHLKVSDSAVSQWRTGSTKNIRNEYLFEVARYLNVEPEWLGAGKGPMRPPKKALGGDELLAVYLDLDTEARRELLRYAKYLSSLNHPPSKRALP